MRGRTWVGGLGVAWALSVAGVASASVTQSTTGETLPRPVTVAENNLVSQSWAWNSQTLSNLDVDGNAAQPGIAYGDYYAPPKFPQFVTGDAITLAGAFKWRSESIDPVADARVDTAGLTPHCALSVEVVLVGGTCSPRLAWYNVTGSKIPPALEDVYPLLQEPATELSCKDDVGRPDTQGFCPLGWDNRSPRNLSLQRWEKKTYTFDLSQDQRYTGGPIAFAVRKGSDYSGCADVAYSLRQHGPKDALSQPYVSALLYDSTAQPGAVYIAFEDGKMPANDWHNGMMTDGDFNDYVVRVAGCFDKPGSSSGEGGAGGAPSLGSSGAGGDASEPVVVAGGASSGGEGSHAEAGEPASAGTPAAAGGTTGGTGHHSTAGETSDGGAELEEAATSGGSGTNSDDGGCGCRTSPRSSSVPFALAALLFGLTLRRRALRR